MAKLTVNENEINLISERDQDYISLTDMANAKDGESRAADIIKNWIRARYTLEFIGTWEIINNPNFKPIDKNDLKFFIELGCTNEELGYVFYCSKRTIAKTKKIMGLIGVTVHNKTPEIIDGQMKCIHCSIEKPLKEFNKLSSAKIGYRTICRDCDKARNKEHFKNNHGMYNARAAKRKAQLLLRMPKWADTVAIKNFYDNCPEGYHVDHIIPLQGKTVSGFHVLNNLQYLPALENISKGNKLIEEYL